MKTKTSWKKGQSGNPNGRPVGTTNHFGDYIRKHPDTPKVIEKLFTVALDDDDERQTQAWRIIASKIAPDLKAQEIKSDTVNHVGVILMPPKKALATPTPTPLPAINDGGVRDNDLNYSSPVEIPQESATPPPSE